MSYAKISDANKIQENLAPRFYIQVKRLNVFRIFKWIFSIKIFGNTILHSA